MNKAMLTVGIILLSIMSLLLINVITNYSTGSELDYYLLKETTDAAMEDAIDYSFIRKCGLYRIDKEKFVESFIFRFANSVDATRNYRIRFYDINEMPPKVSVKVDSLTTLSVSTERSPVKDNNVDISTNYDAILETTNFSDLATEEGLTTTNSNLSSYDRCLAMEN